MKQRFRFPGLVLLAGLWSGGPAFAQFDGALPAAAQQPSPQVRQDSSQPLTVAEPRARAKIHTELGALYFQGGNPAAAIDHLGQALEIDGNYFQALSVRGLVYASLREFAKADHDFTEALARAPNDPEVNNNYGWFLCETGKQREAIAYFDRALRDPLYDTPDLALTNAGNCLVKLGDADQAMSYYLQALRVSRSGAVGARIGLAGLIHKRGNSAEARVYLNEALRMMEQPTAEALWLGIRIERKLGDRAAESGFAAQLRSRYPTSNEYQEFLKGNFE